RQSFEMPEGLVRRMDTLRNSVRRALEPHETPQPQPLSGPEPARKGPPSMRTDSAPMRSPVPAAATGTDDFYRNLFVQSPHWSTPHPNSDEAARWTKIAAFLEHILRHSRQTDP